MICWLLYLLERFQTLVVGVVGFGGVILTLYRNAALARQQHERQIGHERTAVRTALRAELEAIAASYRDRIETLSDTKVTHYGATLSLDNMTDVYKSMIARLGLLSDSQVRLVLRAYLLAQQLPERIRLLADEPDALLRPGEPAEVEPGYAWIAAKNFGAITQLHRNYLRDVEAAIAALSA